MVQTIERSWSSLPGFAKILLVVQASVIVVLSGWLYNEYLNNQYLQVYMFSLLAGKGSILAMIGLGGLVGTTMIGLLLKAGNILGEIQYLSEKVETESDANKPVPASTPTPVRRIANRRPRTEIGRLHGSMRRWKESSGYSE